MIGYNLITKQTGAEGRICSKVLVAQRHFIRREAYFAILLNRKEHGAIMIGSKYGGMDIETVAAESPDAITKVEMFSPPLPLLLSLAASSLTLSRRKDCGQVGSWYH